MSRSSRRTVGQRQQAAKLRQTVKRAMMRMVVALLRQQWTAHATLPQVVATAMLSSTSRLVASNYHSDGMTSGRQQYNSQR